MSDRVVHFELPADNLERAQEFYRDAFGWAITPMPEMSYTSLGTAPTDENGMPSEPGAINGGMLQRQDRLTHPIVTIAVDDIEQALARVERLGGKVVRERFPVGDMGFAAYFADTEDNVVGLWENAAS
jgi:predicted enzyme related to lactoylglutathione lyase